MVSKTFGIPRIMVAIYATVKFNYNRAKYKDNIR